MTRKLRKLFSEAEVLAIRNERSLGASIAEISRFHDRAHSQISQICTGRFHADTAPGSPIASVDRLKLSPMQHQEILATISTHRHWLNDGGASARAIGRQYRLDPRTIRSRIMSAAISDIDRVWALVDRSGGPDAPWPWLGGRLQTGSSDKSKWPGRVTYLGKPNARAHRVIYALTYTLRPSDRLEYIGPKCGFDFILNCQPKHWRALPRHTRSES
jgi:hypothetical protein